MRKFLLLIIAIFLGCGIMMAQDKKQGKHQEEMRKEFQEFKMKYLAQEMELRDDQKTKFFELYDKMWEERGKVFFQVRKAERELRKNSNATDADYENLSKMRMESREKDAEIEKNYDEQFSTFLSAKQIFKMKDAEEKFRKKVGEMRHKKRK